MDCPICGGNFALHDEYEAKQCLKILSSDFNKVKAENDILKTICDQMERSIFILRKQVP